VLGGLKISPSAVGARGATISYSDTQAATTTLTVRRCARLASRGRCSRYVAVGRLIHRDVAGRNSFHFNGRVSGRKLQRGLYKLDAVPSAKGRSGSAVSAAFRIVA
jgi:hypothetical protein